ncbi:MAG: TIGR03435 family protein, partial [Acidobacteriota bacterium]
AQAPKRLEFDVASVRPAADQGRQPQTTAAATLNPSQIRLNYLTMQDFITRAYQVKAYQVVGPDWLTMQRYDISATIPEGRTTADVPAMMKTLLEDRFGIEVHKSKKEFTVYSLTRNKRPFTLVEVQPREQGGAVGVAPQPKGGGLSLNVAQGGLFTITPTTIEGKGITMDVMANNLSNFLGFPTVNGTGLQGFYDSNLTILPEDYQAMMLRAALARTGTLAPAAMDYANANGNVSFIEALDKAGLKLEKTKQMLDVINIDALKKVPTDN